MLIEFHDKVDKGAHDKLQEWRRENNYGFFINCKSKNSMMLHGALCPHPGDTEWEEGEWGSLTRSKKVCSTNREELVSWANKNSVAKLKVCRDCKP